MGNRIAIQSASRKYGAFEERVKKAAGAALSFLKKNGFSVEINLVGDGEIKNLNVRFRGKNKATNVLSFSESEGFPAPDSRHRLLGEIYLAPDYIREKKEDLEVLAVHGVLHLLGFSHERESDRIKMESLENKILKQN